MKLAILLVIMIPNIILAQKFNFYVIDSTSKVPIAFAMVQSEDGTHIAMADEDGWVNLPASSKQVNTITITCIGYKSKTALLASLNFTYQDPIIYLQKSMTSLQDVVVTASANNGIFKTISDLDIHLRPINSSQEVLRMVPGLFIGQHAGGGKAEQIFVRGFDVDHGTDINISVDGMPANMVSHGHGQGYADLHFVIPELIDKVNFNKGPYFASKGNFTTAGFVEFKIKNFLETNFVKTEGGQFNTLRSIIGVNLFNTKGDRRKQSLYFAGEGSYTGSYFDNPQDFSRFNGLLKYHGVIKNNTLIATISGFTSKWNASGQIPDRAVENGTISFYGSIDPNEGGTTSRYNVNLELHTNLPNGATLYNQLFYNKYDFELYSNFTFFMNDPINGDQIRQRDNRNILGYNSVFLANYFIGKFKAETKAGIQVRYDYINNLELTRTKNRTLVTKRITLGDINELNASMYYTQRISFTNKLDVTLGLRYDYFINQYQDKIAANTLLANASIFSPKLNFNYRLNNNIQLYLYTGKGYHSNDTRVTVQKNGKQVAPPAYGTDLGGICKIGNKLLLQAAIWYLWLDQEFVYSGDEGIVEESGQTQRFGFDFSARYEVVKNLYLDMDISVANPKFLNVPRDSSNVPLAPLFTSVGGITYKKQFGWNGSLRYRYVADRPANESNTVIAKGYFIIDGAVNYTTPKWEVGLSVQNVLNTQWKETQFNSESQLQSETTPVTEIHFTAGAPFWARLQFTVYF